MGEVGSVITVIFIMLTFFLSIICAGQAYTLEKRTEQRDYFLNKVTECEELKKYGTFVANQFDGNYNNEITKRIIECKP